MSFIIDGVEMEKVVINGVEMDALYIDNELVYSGKAPPGEQIFEADGVFVVPKGYTEVTVCMIGGGGSGAGIGSQLNADGGGGYSGVIINQIKSTIPEESIQVIIGNGGAGLPKQSDYSYTNGKDGSPSSFGSLIAEGGAGGQSNNVNYKGVGESRTTCYGIANDGISDSPRAYGGQAGFGDGGKSGLDGGYGANPSTAGLLGAGGGAGKNISSGAGGNGLVKISWE